MDEASILRYFSLVNTCQMQEVADTYYDDEMLVIDAGQTYTKTEILDLLATTRKFMTVTYNLVHFFGRADKFALECVVEYRALKDIEKAELEAAGIPQSYIPLRKGEKHDLHVIYTYTMKGDKYIESVGYRK